MATWVPGSWRVLDVNGKVSAVNGGGGRAARGTWLLGGGPRRRVFQRPSGTSGRFRSRCWRRRGPIRSHDQVSRVPWSWGRGRQDGHGRDSRVVGFFSASVLLGDKLVAEGTDRSRRVRSMRRRQGRG